MVTQKTMVKNLEIFCILFHIEKLFHTKRKKDNHDYDSAKVN